MDHIGKAVEPRISCKSEFINYEITNNKWKPIQLTLEILTGTGLATATVEMSQTPFSCIQRTCDGDPQAAAAHIPGLEHCLCKPKIYDASDGAAAFSKRQTQKTSFRASQIQRSGPPWQTAQL